ncbi:MAG TPA: hemerythrin family protein [Rhodoferax sp.]|nr:hemerythrin family protein [Rhodoferax sp.]
MTINESESTHVTATQGLAYNTLRHLIHWKPAMLVGEAEIDIEHERIFALAERASVLSRDHKNAAELVRAFSDFGDLLFSHFEHEERKLSNANYGGLNQHIAQHSAMKSEFEFIRQRLMDNGVGWAYEEQALVVLNFMIGATVGHVLQSDSHFASSIKS